MRDYRKKFKLTPFETLSDLYELGVLGDTAYIQMQNAEEKRLNALKGKKNQKKLLYGNILMTNFFIAGYTSNGAAYGITWEEMGLELYEIQEDIEYSADE